MSKTFLAYCFVLSVLAIQTVSATPILVPELLYSKNITVASEDFFYLDSNYEKSPEYASSGKFSPFYPAYHQSEGFLFNASGNYSSIRITIKDEELLDASLASLQRDVMLFNGSTGQWKNITVHVIPELSLFQLYADHERDLKGYNNTFLRIYLDDTLAREYSIGYYPGDPIPKNRNIMYVPDPVTMLFITILFYGMLTIILWGPFATYLIAMKTIGAKSAKKLAAISIPFFIIIEAFLFILMLVPR